MPPLQPKEARLSSLILFPTIYQTAHLVFALGSDEISSKQFAQSMVSFLKQSKINAQIDRCTPDRVKIADQIWLWIIVECDDITANAIELREELIARQHLLVGYILQIRPRLQWKRVQITEKYLQEPVGLEADGKDGMHSQA